ncbi:MAG TPA: amidohydrolase family protein, partial [Pyrinomonadaceae bacterium]|nr:amidohydrolase family protein [Pyrinomonadaceae bacterium]
MNTLLLRDAKVILPDRELQKASVLIAGEKILEIGAGDTLNGDSEIAMCETVLLPGFIDVHNHGSVGVDVMDAQQEDLLDVSRYLASQGVTGWLPTLVPSTDENYSTVARAIEFNMRESPVGARVLGIHYEGPFVNTAQCGALHKDYFKTYGEPSDLNSLSLPESGARLITLAPEIEGGVALVKELTKRGWVVSIGHTRADVKLLDDAFENGARHMTHFMNAMLPLHHRNPGPIGWGLSRDDVTCDVIADGIHLDQSILRLLLKIKGSGRLSLISDAIAATGKGDGSYQIW